MPYGPPTSSLYPDQHHAYCTTLVALEDGHQMHQQHQLFYKICCVYVTNVYSYMLMMQIQFCIVLYSYFVLYYIVCTLLIIALIFVNIIICREIYLDLI